MNYVSFKYLGDSFELLDRAWSIDSIITVAGLKVKDFENVSFDTIKKSKYKYNLAIETATQFNVCMPETKYDNTINFLDILKNYLLNDSVFKSIYNDILKNRCNKIFVVFKETACINNDIFVEEFNKFCKELNINKNKFYFILSEYYLDKEYKLQGSNILQVPYFGFNLCMWSIEFAKEVNNFYKLYFDNSKSFLRQKHYVCTNNRAREHRTWIMYVLWENGLLDKGYVSYLINNSDLDNEYFLDDIIVDIAHSYGVSVSDVSSKCDEDKIKEFYEKLPIECDTKEKMRVETHESHMSIQGVILNSYFNIVTETDFTFGDNKEKISFLTEKTWKPIVAYQPFILIGRMYQLELLRDMGFKTFHPFIDESYDSLEGVAKFKSIEKEIVRLCSMNMDEMDEWYYGMEDILVHNSNHYIKMLEESADKIGNFLYDYEKEI